MTHGSLFSGIGGFDLAAQWMGWENEFHCEWNEFGRRVLKHYWPKATSYEDITKTDFRPHRGQIDILTGGFPCQPYSTAGKRQGKNDERHLWPEMLRAVQEIRPRWVVAENVRGITSWNGGLVFEEVQAELEAEGYEVQTFLLPAAGVNAPHKRERVWFVAYSDHSDDGRASGQDESESREERVQEWNEVWQSAESGEVFGNAANPQSQQSERFELEQREISQQEQRQFGRDGSRMGDQGDAANSHNEGLQRGENRRSFERSRKNKKQLSAGFVQSTWEEFPTQSPIRHGDDGFSERLDGITFPKWRNESIKAGGNAIVPQVAHQIFKAIEQYENVKDLI